MTDKPIARSFLGVIFSVIKCTIQLTNSDYRFSLVIKEQSQSLIESCLCEYLANSKSHLTKEDFEIIMSHLERISLVNAPLFVDLAMHFDSKTVKTKVKLFNDFQWPIFCE